MKVKILIEKLQKIDPELEVFLNDNEYGPEEISDVDVVEKDSIISNYVQRQGNATYALIS